MLIIRLARIGKKKQPTYRLAINEKTKDAFGDFLEILGDYNPRTKQSNLKIDRIKYWLSQGAQTSPTVHNLLVANKIIGAEKVKAWKPKKKKETEEDKKAEKENTVKTRLGASQPDLDVSQPSPDASQENTPQEDKTKPEEEAVKTRPGASQENGIESEKEQTSTEETEKTPKSETKPEETTAKEGSKKPNP